MSFFKAPVQPFRIHATFLFKWALTFYQGGYVASSAESQLQHHSTRARPLLYELRNSNISKHYIL